MELSGERPGHPGEQHHREVSYFPLRARDGSVVGVASVAQDVTARRRLDELRQRLLDREHQARLRAETVAAAGDALAASIDWDETVATAARVAVPGVADFAVLHLLDGAQRVRVAGLSHRDPAHETLMRDLLARFGPRLSMAQGVGEAVRTGRSVATFELDADALDDVAAGGAHREGLQELGPRSVTVVPVAAGARRLGALLLGQTTSGRHFDDDDVLLAQALADRIGLALENARLHTERSHIAQTLQQSLLPPALPALPGIESAAGYFPAGDANDVGGDFYDLFESEPGLWTVLVGDVAGKGAAAASLTSLARYTLRTASMLDASPVHNLQLLNEVLLDRDAGTCTVLYARLAPEPGALRIVATAAGHPPPLVLRADGGLEELTPPGTLLGAVEEPKLQATESQLGPGDLVLFYTDGATDVRVDGGLLGDGTLRDELAGCARLLRRAGRRAGRAPHPRRAGRPARRRPRAARLPRRRVDECRWLAAPATGHDRGMSLEGKVVAVTGASAGIGRAVVREMASRGAHVGLIARGEERLEAAAAEVRRAGPRACVAVADVADAEQVERAAARIEAELGPIDVWVNVAMSAVLAEVGDVTPEEYLRVTQVTYLGSVHGIQAALRRFVPRDRGTIVQVGSALSRRGIPLQSSYCAAKHAVKGFLDSLRAELYHHGSSVRVSLVQLPGHNTPQFDWVRTRLHRHPQPVAADLPARGRRARGRLRGRAPAARAVGRAADRLHDPGREVRLRLHGPLPRAHEREGPAGGRADRSGEARRQPLRAAPRRPGSARDVRRQGARPQHAAVARHAPRRRRRRGRRARRGGRGRRALRQITPFRRNGLIAVERHRARPAVRVEQARKARPRVESGQAQPAHRAVARDQRGGPAVAEQREVGDAGTALARHREGTSQTWVPCAPSSPIWIPTSLERCLRSSSNLRVRPAWPPSSPSSQASGTPTPRPTRPGAATACSCSTACSCGASASTAVSGPSCSAPATCCAHGRATARRAARCRSRRPGG